MSTKFLEMAPGTRVRSSRTLSTLMSTLMPENESESAPPMQSKPKQMPPSRCFFSSDSSNWLIEPWIAKAALLAMSSWPLKRSWKTLRLPS